METANQLELAPTWSDPDLIQVRATLRFGASGGEELAYSTREELERFATELENPVEGATSAELLAGQRDLSFVELRIREYDRARHLAIEVQMGRARNTVVDSRDHSWELRLTVPVERGALLPFSRALRQTTRTETGTAVLSLPVSWP